MAEQLYTIPINDAFDQYHGCPLCRLHKALEEQSLSYIMGAAMMEPDIRIVTNRMGFCKNHFDRMLDMGNRLSLALMLESHLQYVWENTPEPDERQPGRLGKLKKYDGESPASAMLSQAGSCYVCARVRDFQQRYVSNVTYIYKKDPEFREKLRRQPCFCLEHGAMLLEAGKKELSEERYLELQRDVLTLIKDRLRKLKQDVTAFCRSFDHENAGKPLSEDARYAVERAIALLSGDFER